MSTFYGFKQGQTQDFDATGHRWPITVVKVNPATAINDKQIVFGSQKKLNRSLQGYLKNLSEKITFKYMRSFIKDDLKAGDKLNFSDFFVVGDKIKVTGTSKGKGFQGVVRRHGFKGGPKTHGQSDRQRHPGSIGQTTTPGRVYKGKRMAGHMGAEQVTIKNLEVFAIKPEENLVLIKGLIPGANNSMVQITKWKAPY